MVELHGARVILRDKRLEDAEHDYIWRSDPELARLDAAYPLTMSFDRYLKIFQDQLRYPHAGLPPFLYRHRRRQIHRQLYVLRLGQRKYAG